MWGPAPWMGSMWGLWWVFPLIGLLLCVFFVFTILRIIGRGRFLCMGSHQHDGSEETARLSPEPKELRDQVKKQGAQR